MGKDKSERQIRLSESVGKDRRRSKRMAEAKKKSSEQEKRRRKGKKRKREVAEWVVMGGW